MLATRNFDLLNLDSNEQRYLIEFSSNFLYNSYVVTAKIMNPEGDLPNRVLGIVYFVTLTVKVTNRSPSGV